MTEPTSKPARRVVVDLVGYSMLAKPADEDLGADGVAALEQRIGRIVDEALKEAGAEPVAPRKGTGAGAILVFDHAEPAERFAVALHQEAVREAECRGDSGPRNFRVGIAAGEVLVKADGEPSGLAISEAARLEPKAPKGGILASAEVWAELPVEAQRSYGDEENIAGQLEGEMFPARRRVVIESDPAGSDRSSSPAGVVASDDTKPLNLFISYSHTDELLCEELEKHLANLKRLGRIDVWHDRRLSAGEERRGQIDAHLDSAKVVVLLVSADFMDSDYRFDDEMKRALQRHEAGTARVIPVIVRPCHWEGAPFAKLQALPIEARPVTEWQDHDAAWLNVVEGIGEAIDGLAEESSASTAPESQRRGDMQRLYGDEANVAGEHEGEVFLARQRVVIEMAHPEPRPPESGQSSPESHCEEQAPQPSRSRRRFQIALSFPGEHRDFVEQVAAGLAENVGRSRVLYDRYYEAELARPDLDTYLQGLYHDESELIVVFLCAEYERKEWCGLEWRAIRDLIKKRRAAEVMPFRFDDTEIPGLFSIDGYVWIADRSPREVAKLILERHSLLGDPKAQEPSIHIPPPKQRRTAVWLAAVLATGFLLAGTTMMQRRFRQPAVEIQPTVVEAVVQEPMTVAVLGFAPREPDPEAEWMAAALEEVVSTELRANRRILVPDGKWAAEIRRTTGPTGQLDEADLARLRSNRAPALADTVVTGVWETTGDQLSLRLALRDLETGKERTLSVTGPAQALSALARDAAREVEVDLGLEEFSPGGARASVELVPDGAEALELYAKGLAAWRMGKAERAQSHLLAALAIEPTHPMLHLVYGEILWQLGYTQKAVSAGNEALAQANRLAPVPQLEVIARSCRLLGDWDAARAALKELLAVDPYEMSYRVLQAEIWAGSYLLAKERAEKLDIVATLRSEVRGVFKARAEMAEARLRLDAGEIELAKERALQAVATGSNTGVISLQAHGRLLEATAYELLGEREDAKKALVEAQRLFKHLGNPRRAQDVFLEQAIASAQSGESEKALRMFQDYLGILAEDDDPLNEAIVKLNLANVHIIYSGELEEAEALVKAALKVFPESGTLREVAQANVILGNIYYKMGRLGPTRKSYEQALATFRAIGDRERIARSLANLGEVLILGGELLEAQSNYIAALTINRKLGNKSSEAYDLFSLGQIAVQRDDAKKALKYFGESWALAEDDPYLQGYIQRDRARLAIVEDRAEEADRLAGEAVSTFRGMEDEAAVAMAVQAWAFLERQPPDLERARELGTQVGSRAANSTNRTVRFEADLLAARLDAMGGAVELRGKLEALADKAEADGYMLDAFAARLVLGEIEITNRVAGGRTRLETLRSDAGARGLTLFERHAGSLLTP